MKNIFVQDDADYYYSMCGDYFDYDRINYDPDFYNAQYYKNSYNFSDATCELLSDVKYHLSNIKYIRKLLFQEKIENFNLIYYICLAKKLCEK